MTKITARMRWHLAKKILLFTKESPDYLDEVGLSTVSKHSSQNYTFLDNMYIVTTPFKWFRNCSVILWSSSKVDQRHLGMSWVILMTLIVACNEGSWISIVNLFAVKQFCNIFPYTIIYRGGLVCWRGLSTVLCKSNANEIRRISRFVLAIFPRYLRDISHGWPSQQNDNSLISRRYLVEISF